jgi:hypothetical protein
MERAADLDLQAAYASEEGGLERRQLVCANAPDAFGLGN